ncbi:MAG: hydantoinase/oxoprolinase family protein [Alphaproteobacteria bacterium]|nr:hydantoinase/oxoprolinase family protein [Alphaproteobacteria bacterium]
MGRQLVTKSHALGIDIGGTFTDIIVFDQATGQVHKAKELTTHDDPARGVVTGVKKALSGKISASAIYRTVHATTLFTNALIERKGAVTGLITTEGFRDALEIGRERKYELYDIFIAKPAPLAPRNLRLEAAERMDAQGNPVTPLDEKGLLAAAKQLVGAGVESLAIVFLHAYANPAHEKAAARAVAKAHPDLYLSVSHEVSPEIREYERSSTTVINAFFKPLAERYIERLASEIAGLGADAPFFMMLSNGGLTHVAEAKRRPVQLLESGPAAGALVGAYFGSMAGEKNVLAFDMGGTTAKLALVEDGEPRVAYRFEAAREKRFIEGSGMPVNISTIELIEIGAGGGSIAHVDALGLLKVGPQSSGSQPGPACYGQGGKSATVTDADMLLGFLNADYFAGGSMKIDLAAAKAAMARLAEPLGLSETEVAWGIHDVVNENMASAARVHIAEQGKDPRGFTLLATGGAGPVHAFYVARKLGLKRILCPVAAGVASALGLLIAPARVDRVATVAVQWGDIDWAALEKEYRALEQDAARVISETGLDAEAADVTRLADMRYVGQGFEVVVTLPAGPYDASSAAGVERAFTETYRRTFSRTPPEGKIEIINIRVSMRARVPGPGIAFTVPSGGSAVAKVSRKVYSPEAAAFVDTPVYDRAALPAGVKIAGPAIVEEAESTLVVGPNATMHADENGNLIVDLQDG